MQTSHSTIPRIVRLEDSQCLELRGEVRHQLLDARDTGGAFALARSRFQKGSGSPKHAHTREDEFFVVLDGQFEFCFGDEAHCAQAGDFVFGPRRLPHSYTCASNMGELLIGVVGAGFEEFFRHLAVQQENGKTPDPPTMRTIASVFGVQFSNFEELEASDCQPKIGNAYDAECLEAFGHCVRPLISSDETNGRFCLSESETPSFCGPPLHVHEQQDEVFVVLAGRYEFALGDARVQVGPDDVVFAPRGTPHSFRVVSSDPGRCLILDTPGGFDRFFRDSAKLHDEGYVSHAEFSANAAKHGIRFFTSDV